ncbi:MAG: hypothetical protein JSV52_00615 [Candidatus Zixiibacteriota bacterium]|nr:MAG: hypothetical protein JSV52_00615 [candidate division Zixibacteria bacterium]
MTDGIIKRVKYSRTWRPVMILSAIFGAVLYAAIIVLWYRGSFDTYQAIVLLVMGSVFPYAIIDAIRFELILTEQYIERRGVRRKRLYYHDIGYASVERNSLAGRDSLVVRTSRFNAIQVTVETDEIEEIIIEILTRTRNNPGLTIGGDKRVVEDYLEIARLRQK